MRKIIILVIGVLCTFLMAKEEEFHSHNGGKIKLNFERSDFHHSKTKEKGNIYGVELDYATKKHHTQIYYEKAKTDTKKIVPKDLNINKYTFKYSYNLNRYNRLFASYIKIDDNLVAQTGSGNIYGIGYGYKNFALKQYGSIYKDFKVYQTDLKGVWKKEFFGIHTKIIFIPKYIHLSDKNSNSFSTNAKNNYLTVGLILHAHYKKFNFSLVTFEGKRIFAVMHDGFRVQHHAMEFKASYMAGIGYALSDNITSNFHYTYHKAKEINFNNAVTIGNISVDILYSF